MNEKPSKVVKSGTTADARKIRELQRQVRDLQTALKRRFPNSIPALIYASEGGASEVGKSEERGGGSAMTRHLEAQVDRLEEELKRNESGYAERVRSLHQKHSRMEVCHAKTKPRPYCGRGLTAKMSGYSGRVVHIENV